MLVPLSGKLPSKISSTMPVTLPGSPFSLAGDDDLLVRRAGNLTPLRLLDILAWTLGNPASKAAVPAVTGTADL